MENAYLNSRQQKIIDLLSQKKVMESKDLSAALNVSKATIRRDIDYLDHNGYVNKFHGSVSIIEEPLEHDDLALDHRNSEEKHAIARVAAGLIKPRNIISVDTGSTTRAIAEFMPKDSNIKVITNSLKSALKFAQTTQNEVIQIGGLIHLGTYSTTDFLATEFLSGFNTDIAFITASSFNFPEGAFDAIVSLIELKRKYISITKRVVLLIDSSKFDLQSMYLSVPIGNVDTMITDSKTPSEIIDRLKDSIREVYVADIKTQQICEHYIAAVKVIE